MEPTVSYLWRLAGLALCYRAAPGYEARLMPDAALIFSGEPVADLNYALIDTGPAPEARLREFGAVFHARKLPIVVLLTEAIADKLAPVALDLGLQYVVHFPLMVYRPTDPQAEVGRYQIDHIASVQGLHESNGLIANAFSLPEEAVNRAFGSSLLDGPGVDVFVARQDGTAISTLQTTRAGTIVGIWAMATAPESQRQGAGRAVLSYALTYHYRRGARLFYLGATEAGHPLYERVGFQTQAQAAVWVGGHTTPIGGE